MYKRILHNRSLILKERLKRLLAYYFIRRGAGIQWNRRYKKVFALNPDYKAPAEKSIEEAHLQYWRPYKSRINLSTLRVTKNISGISDPRIMPEEIFKSDIELTLNNTSAVEYLSFKSFYNRWFPGGAFPYDYFHNINGEWLDHDLNTVSFNVIKAMAKELDYPVVLKPNRDSLGGKNIFFPPNADELICLIKNRKNFLVQEKITQHPFFNQFNPHGLNTLRVYVYRSVKDNHLHILNIALRMGVGGSLDNETAGGIVVRVRKDGFLNGFALDKYGVKYLSHPDTGVNFNQKLPDFDALPKLAMKIAHKIFFARLVGLDLCYDENQIWRMIEINISGATIRFAQYHGALFFDEFSDEVYDYCLRNHWTLL